MICLISLLLHFIRFVAYAAIRRHILFRIFMFSSCLLSSGQGRGGAMGRSRGGGSGGGRGPRRGRGRGRGRGEKVSADDLDADLEKYHAEAMQEN